MTSASVLKAKRGSVLTRCMARARSSVPVRRTRDRTHLLVERVNLLPARLVDLVGRHRHRAELAHDGVVTGAPVRVGGDAERVPRGGKVRLAQEITVTPHGRIDLVANDGLVRGDELGVGVALRRCTERRLLRLGVASSSSSCLITSRTMTFGDE